jgi:hypothetical protein
VAERERAEDERRERAGIAGAMKALATARELAATARRVLRVIIAMIVFPDPVHSALYACRIQFATLLFF